MTASTTEPVPTGTARRLQVTSGRLLGLVYGVCVVFMSVSICAEMVVGYSGQGEQPRSLTEQLVGVLGFGTAGLVVALLGVRLLGRTPQRARIGAIVYAVLAVPALAFFWCGMPGMLGAAAAHLGGRTVDGPRSTGAPATFGLIGLVLAVLNPLVTFLAVTISWIISFV